MWNCQFLIEKLHSNYHSWLPIQRKYAIESFITLFSLIRPICIMYVHLAFLRLSLSLSHIHWSSFTNENVWPDLGPRTIGYPGTNIFWPAINHGAPGWSASVHTYGRDPRGASFKKKKRKRSVHPPVVIVHDEKWPSNVSTRVVVWMVRSRHSPVLFNAFAFVHLLPFLRKFLSLFFGTSFERDQKLQWIVVERNMI